MSTPSRKSWTQKQFFAWAETQQHPYEFDGLQAIAMTGGTIAQGIIVHNLQRGLGTVCTASAARYCRRIVALKPSGQPFATRTV
jgi:hypothetical protein